MLTLTKSPNLAAREQDFTIAGRCGQDIREVRMGLRRRVEITIQRRELAVTRGGQPPVTERCPGCNREVNMLPVELAAKVAGVSPRTLYRRIEQGKVHFRELSDGAVLVCENSLSGG